MRLSALCPHPASAAAAGETATWPCADGRSGSAGLGAPDAATSQVGGLVDEGGHDDQAADGLAQPGSAILERQLQVCVGSRVSPRENLLLNVCPLGLLACVPAAGACGNQSGV